MTGDGKRRSDPPGTSDMDNGASGLNLDWVAADVRRILGRALDGHELTVAEGVRLTEVQGRELSALMLVADEMRRRQVGDVVTYVVNRNINFTNVCIKHCTFCAFTRDHREEEGYFLPLDEVVRRAIEAWEMGASEVCIQAGLPPKLDGSLLHRPLPRDQGRGAGDASARVLARGDPLRLRALGPAHPRLPEGAPGRRSRHPARHLRRDAGPGHPRRDRQGPHHRRPVDRGDRHRPRPRDPHHVHDHVRPRRAPGALGAPHGPLAEHPAPHRRVHRVRPAVAHLSRGADVPAGPRPGVSARARPASRSSRCTRSPG